MDIFTIFVVEMKSDSVRRIIPIVARTFIFGFTTGALGIIYIEISTEVVIIKQRSTATGIYRVFFNLGKHCET